MGDILATLGLGPRRTTQSSAGIQPPYTTPPIVSPTDVMGASPLGSEANPDQATVTADGWRPRKPTLLGTIADAFLMSRGMKPAYAINRDARNVNEALSGYVSDPDKAMRRLMKIRGYEDDAIKMIEKKRDDDRASGILERQNKALDLRNEQMMFEFAANMMNAATPETWKPMRDLALKRAGARGIDLSPYIPETYDGMVADVTADSAVKVKDQRTLDERRENNTERRAIQRDRLEETGRHNRVQEGQAAANEAGRNARDANNPKKSNPNRKMVKTSKGWMELDKTGRFGRIGDQEWMRVEGTPGSSKTRWERVR